MQVATRSNLVWRAAHKPKRNIRYRMAVKVDRNRPYVVSIVTSAISILIMAGLVYYSEQNWMWRLMWLSTVSVTVLCTMLAVRIRQGIE